MAYYPKISVGPTGTELFWEDFSIISFRVRPGPTHQLPKLSQIFFNLFFLAKALGGMYKKIPDGSVID